MGRNRKYIGQTIGSWTVLKSSGLRGKKRLYLCRCVCGRERDIDVGRLWEGNPRCLCSKKSKLPMTPERRAFHNARNRCNNPKSSGFINYGGRGIQFKFQSFEQFFSELGPRPFGYSLDRIEKNGHYAPGNVRWTDKPTQSRNRRTYKAIVNYTDEQILTEFFRRNLHRLRFCHVDKLSALG